MAEHQSLPLLMGLPDEAPRSDPKWTERMLLDRLRTRYSVDHGNGPEWVFMEHVADQTGWANRRIDGLAVHLWRSRHHEVHAFEVKISRGDFRRELADLSKSEVWTSWCEYFWIVAPHGVLTKADIPEQWGLLLTRGGGLAVAKRAPRLQPKPDGYLPAPDLPRSVVAAMLRQAARLPAPTVVVTPSRTDRQPPDSSSVTKGGESPVAPAATNHPDLVTDHEENR